MKKALIVILLIISSINICYSKQKPTQKEFPKDVLAPAIQFNFDDYKDCFKKSTDYKVYLHSKMKYLITCDDEIIGVRWGDLDNVVLYDKKDNMDNTDMKKVFLKLKQKTNTYISLYKQSGEIVNIITIANSMFDDNKTYNLGLCRIDPYEE